MATWLTAHSDGIVTTGAMTCRSAYDTNSVQDRLLQRTLNLRGPAMVAPVEIQQQIETFGQKYENITAWGTIYEEKPDQEAVTREQEARARRRKSKVGKKISGQRGVRSN